jgi:hypothetical protein
MLQARSLEHVERVVAAGVINLHDFVVDVAAQGGGDFGEQEGDVVALVEYRHDYG